MWQSTLLVTLILADASLTQGAGAGSPRSRFKFHVLDLVDELAASWSVSS